MSLYSVMVYHTSGMTTYDSPEEIVKEAVSEKALEEDLKKSFETCAECFITYCDSHSFRIRLLVETLP